MRRVALSLALALVAACTSEPSESDVILRDWGTPMDEGVDGPVPGPDGALGVCCPPEPPGCGCTFLGGWYESPDQCDVFVGNHACDVSEWRDGTDEWGCPILIPGRGSCLDMPLLVGEECRPARGCRSAAALCLHDDVMGNADIGGPDDPILDHPDGADTVVARTRYPDGLCSLSYPGGTPYLCDPDSSDEVCTEAGVCVVRDVGPVCFQRCDPDAVGNDECRDGYRCDPEHSGCLPGCQSDDECRIARQETNGIEGLQGPADCAESPSPCAPGDCAEASPAEPEACADPGSNFDRLVYDTESTSVCDLESYRCTD